LERTSRTVRITPVGATYLAHCQRALQELSAGQDRIAHAQRVPRGVLRVSLPPILGPALMQDLAHLTESHPHLSLDLRLTDRKVRLLDEEVDVVIRIGRLEDSALIVRALRTPRWVTVASPAYLARHPAPRAVSDLAEHVCLKFTTPAGGLTEWTFAHGEGRIPTHHRIDQGEALVAAALAGLGVIQAFDFLVSGHLASGRLVELLPRESAPAPSIHALCRPGTQRSPKVQVFMDHVANTLRD
jgi:DNA-binding transcriptional LysR family regulator